MRASLPTFGLAFAFAGCTLLLGYGDEVQLADGDAGASSGVNSSGAPSSSGTTHGGSSGSGSGGSSGDGSGLPFCEQAQHTLCTSFDDDNYLRGWLFEPGNTSLERTFEQFVSPPAALEVAARRQDAAMLGGINATFNDRRNAPFTLDYDYKLRVQTATARTYMVASPPLLLIPMNSAPTYQLQMLMHADTEGQNVALSFNELDQAGGGPNRTYDTSRMLPLNTWLHVKLHVVNAEGNSSLRVEVDGDVILETGLTYLRPSDPPTVGIGVAALSEEIGAEWRYQVDDLAIDLR